MSWFDRAVSLALPAVPKPIVYHFSKRYIAGPETNDAFRAVRALAADGAMSTLDILGEVFPELLHLGQTLGRCRLRFFSRLLRFPSDLRCGPRREPDQADLVRCHKETDLAQRILMRLQSLFLDLLTGPRWEPDQPDLLWSSEDLPLTLQLFERLRLIP